MMFLSLWAPSADIRGRTALQDTQNAKISSLLRPKDASGVKMTGVTVQVLYFSIFTHGLWLSCI